MVAGHGDALAHQHFVAGAAQSGQTDAGRAFFFGQGDEFRGLRGGDDHFGQHRVVAVQQDVDLVGFEDAQVDVGQAGRGHAEHDVGQFGGDHGAAPAVAEGGAAGLQQDVDPIVVHTHVGAMQHFYVFAVNAARVSAGFIPDSLAGFGGTAGQRQFVASHAVIFHHLPGQPGGDFLVALAVRFHAVFGGQRLELLRFGNGIDVGFTFADEVQGFQDVTAVIPMRGRAGGHHPGQVAGDDNVGVCAADPFLRPVAKGVNPARPHDTDAAACAQVTVTALGLLFFQPIPDRFDAFAPGHFQHDLGIAVDGSFFMSVGTECSHSFLLGFRIRYSVFRIGWLELLITDY